MSNMMPILMGFVFCGNVTQQITGEYNDLGCSVDIVLVGVMSYHGLIKLLLPK